MTWLTKILLRIPFGPVATGTSALLALVMYLVLVALGLTAAQATTAASMAAVVGLCVGIALDTIFGLTRRMREKAYEGEMQALERDWSTRREALTSKLLAYAEASHRKTIPSGYFYSGWLSDAKHAEDLKWVIKRVLQPYAQPDLDRVEQPKTLSEWHRAAETLAQHHSRCRDKLPWWRRFWGPSPQEVFLSWRRQTRFRIADQPHVRMRFENFLQTLPASEREAIEAESEQVDPKPATALAGVG